MEARKGARRPAPTTSSCVLGRAFLPRPAALPCGVHGLRVACVFAGARGGTAQWGARGAARGSLLLAVLGNEELRRAAVGAAAMASLLPLAAPWPSSSRGRRRERDAEKQRDGDGESRHR